MPVAAVSKNRTTSGTVAIKQMTGWSIAETSGAAAATVKLRKGSATGEIVCVVTLSAGQSANMAYTVPVRFDDVNTGDVCFIDIASGAATVSVYGF